MNSSRFTRPINSARLHGNPVSDIPDDLRQQIIAMIRDCFAYDGLPRKGVEQFKRELAFGESLRSDHA